MMTSGLPEKKLETKPPRESKKNTPKQLNITNLRKVFKEATFNPKDPGFLNVVADIKDPNYYMLRAIENLQRARTSRGRLQQEQLTQAIQLVAMAKVIL